MLLLLLLGSQAATAQVDTNHHHLMGGEGQVEEETVYDPDLQQYIVIRRAGGAELSRQYLSEKEYRTRQSAREIMDYWKKKEKEKRDKEEKKEKEKKDKEENQFPNPPKISPAAMGHPSRPR